MLDHALNVWVLSGLHNFQLPGGDEFSLLSLSVFSGYDDDLGFQSWTINDPPITDVLSIVDQLKSFSGTEILLRNTRNKRPQTVHMMGTSLPFWKFN